MRRIAMILAVLAASFALAERPEMPPIGVVITAPATGVATQPDRPKMPPVETHASVAAETMPAEPVEPVEPPATIPAATMPETQPAEVTSAPAVLTPATQPVTQPAKKDELRVSFSADHPSGLYYAREEAKIDVIFELPRSAGGA